MSRKTLIFISDEIFKSSENITIFFTMELPIKINKKISPRDLFDIKIFLIEFFILKYKFIQKKVKVIKSYKIEVNVWLLSRAWAIYYFLICYIII